MSILVDSNVLIDVVQPTGEWRDWSLEQIRKLGGNFNLVINAIIYSEVSAKFESRAGLDAVLPPGRFIREELSFDAAFLAGKVHARYRGHDVNRRQPTLPDFFIGAHALVKGHRLLTRDARRYRSYFPEVEIIAPDTHP